jgi:two-component sensor histidine kinase
VVQQPTSQGFGTRLIDAAVRDLHGQVELTFARSGLRAKVTIPMQ